jgi:hypothetical protein
VPRAIPVPCEVEYVEAPLVGCPGLAAQARVLRTDRAKLECHRMVRYVRSLERLSMRSEEVSPVELRGYALASNLKTRRPMKVAIARQVD